MSLKFQLKFILNFPHILFRLMLKNWSLSASFTSPKTLNSIITYVRKVWSSFRQYTCRYKESYLCSYVYHKSPFFKYSLGGWNCRCWVGTNLSVGIYLEVISHALINWEMTRMVKYLSISRCLYYKGIRDGVLYLFYWFVLWICLCRIILSKKNKRFLMI